MSTLPTIYEDPLPRSFVSKVRDWLGVLESRGPATGPPVWPTLQEIEALPREIRDQWAALIIYVTRHAATRRQECVDYVRAFLADL